MKNKLTILILSLFTIFSLACSDTPQEKKEAGKVVMKTFDVKGMTCEGCEASIVNHVTEIEGVVSSKASHLSESVIVKFDESKTNINAIMEVISSTGYKVNGLKRTQE